MKKITLIFLLVTSFTLTASAFSFPTNLKLGSRGEEVKNLQILLNQDKDTQIATSGAGSPNNETTYFGPATVRAVIKFQNKYKQETLNPIGLTKGTGFVGALTRKKLSTMGTSGTTVTTTTPTTTCLTKYDPKTGKLCVTTTSTAVQTCLTKYDPKTGKLCSQITGTSSSSVTPSSITSNIISPTPAYSFSGGGGGGGYTTPSTSQTQTPTPTNGGWSAYGTCSATACGTTGNRVRTCNNPTPLNGGAYCSGTSSETCSAPACGVNTYTLTATAGANGVISPLGGTTVSQGGSQTYTITPNAGYQLATLTIGGGPVSPVSSYTFTNVQGDNTINATFSAVPASVFATCGSVTYPAPSGTANNIVFTFDKAYPCGQYANGDWWVAPLTPGGIVTIMSITPAQATRTATGHMINGAQVNPTSPTAQSLDADTPAYYTASTLVSYPLVVNTATSSISSVIKAVGRNIALPARPALQFAAVLTVISTAADKSGQFRPSFFGTATNKLQISVSSINTAILGQADLSSVSAVSSYPFSQIVTDYQGLQLDFLQKYINEFIHPYDNSYKNTGYGSEASIEYSKPLIRFSANDFNYSDATHKQALINYLQRVIDLAGNVQGGTSFDASGGGYGFGRKLPLLFAGQVLQNSTITGLASSGIFAEDLSFYQSTSTGRVLHGEYYSYGAPYTWPNNYFQDEVTGSGSKTTRDPMGWTDSGSGGNAGAYLACCVAAPARYEAMAASILGFGAVHPFDWMLLISNRIQNHGLQFLPDPFAKYDGVPGNMGITWGLNTATGYFFTGSGRTPTKDGIKTVYHKDTLGEAIWSYWIANHDIVPPADISTLTNTPGTHQNVLNWSESTGADHYNIYRATDSALSGSSYLGTTTSITYTDSELTAGNTYAYWVVAVDAAGNVSNMSNKVIGTSN